MADETPLGERVAILEQRSKDRDVQLRRMEDKLDRLVEAFNMGQGAFRVVAKMGGVAVLVAMALGWLWDRVYGPLSDHHQ